MEVPIRGSIEHRLDTILEQEVLLNALAMFEKKLSPAVKNGEDALFGYVIGRALQFSFDVITMHYGRSPTNEELDEISKILNRRAMEIKSKITLLANR